MKVILLDNIKGVGKKDEIINASDGYARNFLFPKKLAVEANNENMSKLKAKKQSEQYKKDVNKENAEKIAKKLDDITLTIKVKAGENGKIFGGVTSKEISEELKKLEDILQGFKDQKRDAKIALKQINQDLNYIFFAKDRLTIEMIGEQYLLKSRGKAVSPSKISVGERNAIALCYFFSEIMREQREEDIYKNQYCIIIDDPVSSFDMENRVGILSFLKHQLNKFDNKEPSPRRFPSDSKVLSGIQFWFAP